MCFSEGGFRGNEIAVKSGTSRDRRVDMDGKSESDMQQKGGGANYKISIVNV